MAEHQDPPNSPDFHRQIPHRWEGVMKWVHVVLSAHLCQIIPGRKVTSRVRGEQTLGLPGLPAFGAALFCSARCQEAQMGSVQREFSSRAIHLRTSDTQCHTVKCHELQPKGTSSLWQMLILLWLGTAFPRPLSAPRCCDMRPRDGDREELLEVFSDINDSVVLRQRRAAGSSSRTERTSLQGATPHRLGGSRGAESRT